jgi:hypothetical protein
VRHFPRLNRVAYGILGRRHLRVLTLLERNAHAGFAVRSQSPQGIRATTPREGVVDDPSFNAS